MELVDHNSLYTFGIVHTKDENDKKVTLRVQCTSACIAYLGGDQELFASIVKSDGFDPDVGMEIMIDDEVVIEMSLACALIMDSSNPNFSRDPKNYFLKAPSW